MLSGSGNLLGKFGRIVAVVMASLIVMSMSFQHMGMINAADMSATPAHQMTGMGHMDDAPTPDHGPSPECLMVCAGVSLTDLAFATLGIDADMVAFAGMSTITAPTGRQIDPAERPPKFV